jgi:hypothetical protein
LVSVLYLDDFFQDWIYGYYFPQYLYSWAAAPRAGTSSYDVHIHVRQTQTSTPQAFRMPIQIQLWGVEGNPRYTLWNDQREQDFVVASPGVPTSISFDPQKWILCTKAMESYRLRLLTTELSDGTELTAYADTLEVLGGDAPYYFQVTAGAPPPGITLNSESGILSGTPTGAGDYMFTVDVGGSADTLYHAVGEMTLSVAGLGYKPGDLDGSLAYDAVDLNVLIDYLFLNGTLGVPENAADINGDCVGDALDLNAMIDLLFFNGPDPVPGCIQ